MDMDKLVAAKKRRNHKEGLFHLCALCAFLRQNRSVAVAAAQESAAL
jgi:hypothetical protein